MENFVTANVRTSRNRSGSGRPGVSPAHSPSGSLLALGCFGLLAGAGKPVAAAQPGAQTPVELERVLVSGEPIDADYNADSVRSDKSTAALLDTPQTISVITQEVIRERAARTLADVLGNTPGVSFNAGENGFGTSGNNFQLRGFDASGSVFVDNARDSGSYARDVFNVERVEVAKGPAADNGRGSAGGYVNLSTKLPGAEGFILADLSYGLDSYDSRSRKRATVDFNQALGSSSAVRLNFVLEEGGIPGRAVAGTQLKGFAPSLALGLGGGLRAVFAWEHLDREDLPDWGVPGASVKLTGYDPSVGLANNPAAAGAPRDAFYGLASDFDNSLSDVLFGRIEYDFAAATLSNQLRWNKVERASRYTSPTGFNAVDQLVTTGTTFYRRENKSLSNLTNLSAWFGSSVTHNLAAGLELTREESDADRMGAAVPAPGSTSLFAPDPYRIAEAPFDVTQTAQVEVDTVAVYLYDTIAFGERFQLTGGVRGERYKVRLGSLDAAGNPVGSVDDFTQKESSVSGKLGLVFKPVPNASIYGSVGLATQPYGSYLSNPDISRTGDNAFPGLVAGADPVRSLNYETGLKWDFRDGALSTTAALFRTEKRKVPVVGRDVPGGDPAGTNVLQGYHRQVVQGIELGVSGAITPRWQVFAGAMLADSERRISQALDDARRVGSSGAGDYGSATSTNGDSLAFTPDFSASLWSTYRLPAGLTLGGGLQHVGAQYMGRPDDASRIIPNGRWGKLPSYTVFNALVSWNINELVSLRLNVDNVTNEKYVVSTNWPGSRATLGPSRSYLISLGLDF